ncbi:MAG: hypothetical protein HYY96_02075 [Candidatus Tectomicrobia bacterium]|nr:hypothetical protein [Candidatus Tectomicrobia bacterium]
MPNLAPSELADVLFPAYYCPTCNDDVLVHTRLGAAGGSLRTSCVRCDTELPPGGPAAGAKRLSFKQLQDRGFVELRDGAPSEPRACSGCGCAAPRPAAGRRAPVVVLSPEPLPAQRSALS